MKKAVNILSWLLIFSGLVWILQGQNILPGSFMTGDPTWTRNGIFTVIVGILGNRWSKLK
jgi:hypothetical protein